MCGAGRTGTPAAAAIAGDALAACAGDGASNAAALSDAGPCGVRRTLYVLTLRLVAGGEAGNMLLRLLCMLFERGRRASHLVSWAFE